MKKGSAELLILALIEDRARHGYEISKLIAARSKGALQFHVASLYPLLYRLEDRGWIEGRWVEKAGQRRRRCYRHHARRAEGARRAALRLAGVRPRAGARGRHPARVIAHGLDTRRS